MTYLDVYANFPAAQQWLFSLSRMRMVELVERLGFRDPHVTMPS
jgi:hypothetical protein